ncbi:GNAT family N-acetyltransferase [Mycoplasmatota bacterium]|nr:GNAT family N-acetyltransferase [Mycoplasmatota bacterium]
MKISFIEDRDGLYHDQVIYHLRKYNRSHTGEVGFNQTYIYAFENEELVGAFVIVYFWDWISIRHVSYKNVSVLKAFIHKTWELYIDKAVGIKLITPVIDRWKDFLMAGFIPSGAVNLTDNYNYYYADGFPIDEKISSPYQCIVKNEEEPKYKDILEEKDTDFNNKNNITAKVDDIRWVALKGNQFIGGITCEIYEDSLYVSHIVVEESYRKRNIGSKLMELAEEKAKERQLKISQLGTCEFQAKGFYELQGYRVVHTRQDNPRGFKSYTMFKDLV